MKNLVAILFVSMSLISWGQRNCGTMEAYERALNEDSYFQQNQEAIEQFTNEFLSHAPDGDRALVTIPVVVHVVWNTTSENISDAQVLSQIDVLNKDFSKTNSDVGNTPNVFTASNSNIQFCLATVDPNGNSTNGITRTQTSVTAFSTNDAVKFASNGGKDAWPSSQYLNIWVCDISGGILGYAQFPGGAASTDGVVIDYLYYGTTGTATAPFNLGRTATHEVGHWLNLRHIWGDATCGSDLVSDTPTHNTSNYGCPTYPHLSTCTGTPVEMTMNYMDYTDDACMYMFSDGQSARMQALFTTGGARSSLLTSNGCGVPTPIVCGVPSSLSATNVTSTSSTLNWSSVAGALGYTLQYKLSSASLWTTISNLTGNSYSLTGLTSGSTYSFQVSATCSAGIGNYSAATNFVTTSLETSPTCTDSYETNNSSSKAKTISVNTNILAKISSTTDQDWFRFSTTTSQKNIKIDLTTLPADYDVVLYNPSGVQVGISQLTGTSSEYIIYNNGPVGTYKVKIYGYNGANNTLCYTLRANRSGTAFREGEGVIEDSSETEINAVSSVSLTKLFAFPNPFNSSLNVQFTSASDDMVYLNLFDSQGKLVFQNEQFAYEGVNVFKIDVSPFPAGYYHLLLNNSMDKVSIPVLKN